jgi:hypothetical protein
MYVSCVERKLNRLNLAWQGQTLGESGHDSLSSQYGTPDDIKLAIIELHKAFPGNSSVKTDIQTLQTYGSSENSYHPSVPHSVVVHARSTEDVVHVVNISRWFKIPIIAYSGATSLEGHFSGVWLLLVQILALRWIAVSFR